MCKWTLQIQEEDLLLFELAAVDDCASLYTCFHGNGSSVELVVCSGSRHDSFTLIPSDLEPQHTVSAGSSTQVVYSEFFFWDLNMLFSNPRVVFKMTAKCEGHEGRQPSYCWITRVSWTRNLFSRNWDVEMHFHHKQTFLSICSVQKQLNPPHSSVYDKRYFPLKSSSPPIYFCCLIIAPPHASEKSEFLISPLCMHSFLQRVVLHLNICAIWQV